MILQIDHHHQEIASQKPAAEQKSKIIAPSAPIPPPRLQETTRKTQVPAILMELLQNSNDLVNTHSKQKIKQFLKYNEQKVHLSFSNEPNDYLVHLVGKNKSQNYQLMRQIIGLQNDLFSRDIESGDKKVKQKIVIQQMKSSISSKITEMKQSILSLSSLDRKASRQFQSVMQFRQKSYWKVPSKKTEQLKQFLSKMRRIQSQHKKKYQKSLQHQQNEMKKHYQKQQQDKEDTRKQLYYKQLQKQTKWRKQRQRYNELDKKKRDDIQNLLKKINPDKPIYKRNEEQFIRNIVEPLQEERQKKLDEIRESRLPFNQEQFDQHLQKYNQYKESLLQQHKRKNQEERQMDSKLQQQLNQLYHSQFHKDITPRFYSSVKVQREKIQKKVKIFEEVSLVKHQPRIDIKKKQKLQQMILELQLAQNKKKRKVVHEDGSVSIQDKPVYDYRKIGVQYLSKLKEQSQGKPRVKIQKSVSMEPQATKVKRIDYLRQNRPNVKLTKHTIGEWKKVVQDLSYSPRQKYDSIMEKAFIFEQKAKQKQQQFRSYKKGEKANILKQQMDKLYLQSVAAKMVVLKDIILKE